VTVLIPPLSLCTDNAAIGAIAWEQLERGDLATLELDVRPGTDRSRRQTASLTPRAGSPPTALPRR
jgi:tRNA A37 threonylcarbamoyltransferase TsaD